METDSVQWHVKKNGRCSGRSKLKYAILGLLCLCELSPPVRAQESKNCPIGFYESPDEISCYQIKTLETSDQKYERCSGNLVEIDFYKQYKFISNEHGKNAFWTDYVRAYAGGPFINWRLGDDKMGQPLELSSIDDTREGMCAIVDLAKGAILPADCNAKHSRLCVIMQYSKADVPPWTCPTEDFLAFTAPIPACLQAVYRPVSARRVAVRASWSQSRSLCDQVQGFLPHRSYVYINHVEFSHLAGQEVPLGIEMIEGEPKWTDLPDNISETEKNFPPYAELLVNGDVALLDSKWVTREPSQVYNNVICEYFVNLPVLQITYNKTMNDMLYFKVHGEQSAVPYVRCFTDSKKHYPVLVPIQEMDENTFSVQPDGDGFYWCLEINTSFLAGKESERVLFVKDKEELKNTHAILLQFNSSEFTLEYLTEEAIISILTYGYISESETEKETTTSWNYERTRHAKKRSSALKETLTNFHQLAKPMFKEVTIKGIYDDLTVLIHAKSPEIQGFEENDAYSVKYVRKLLTCPEYDDLPETELGETAVGNDPCVSNACGGNFNIGADWVMTENTTCSSITTTTPTESPDQQVNDVLDAIDEILNAPINSSILESAAVMINDVLSLGDGVDIPAKILQGLDTMVDRMILPEDMSHLTIVESNLVIMISDRKGPEPISGILLNEVTDGFTSDSLEVLTEDSKINGSQKHEIIVRIPPKLGANPQSRLSFLVFRNDRAFNPNLGTGVEQRINTRILSISMTNTTDLEAGEHVDFHLRPYGGTKENEKKICAFWDFAQNGSWSTKGCELLPKTGPGGLDTCRCHHLTHFAQLITTNSKLSKTNNDILTIISFICCSLSLVGIICIYFTGILFKSWRADFINKIWLHLSSAVGIMIVTFLCIAFVDMRQHHTSYCVISGVALHYSVLASFCWMFIAAVVSYQRLVTVFIKPPTHRLLKAGVFGWLFPIVPIAALLAWNADSYTEHFDANDLNIEFCYPSGLSFWLAVFLPVALVVVCNVFLFAFIIYSVFVSSKIKRHGDNKQLFRGVTVGFLLFYLFGLTWVFGMLSNYLVMAYLFCITATLQGVVLFVFFVIGNKKTRDLWLVKLGFKEPKKIPATTSISRSYPSKGSNNGQGLHSRNLINESTTRPRSLTGNTDNARFS